MFLVFIFVLPKTQPKESSFGWDEQ